MNKYAGRPYYVVTFMSRNKDNQNVEGFKKRVSSFLTQKTDEELVPEFDQFVRNGVENEYSRMYRTVNERDTEKVRVALQHYLIDHPELSLAKLDSLVASLATKPGTAKTKRFLLDYDSKEHVKGFVANVAECVGGKEFVTCSRTPNGYAVVTDKGFDTRKLLEAWKDCTLHRDGLLFIRGMKKGDIYCRFYSPS